MQDVLTGDGIKIPWSWRESFIVKRGLPVISTMFGPQIWQPADGCDWACNVPVCFSWTPINETETYKLELSQNNDMSDPLVSIEVASTGHRYDGKLKKNNIYFWRVGAEKPHHGE